MKNGGCLNWPGYRRLAAATLRRAALDAKMGKRPGAVIWLRSPDAVLFFDALGLDRQRVDVYLDGLPGAKGGPGSKKRP